MTLYRQIIGSLMYLTNTRPDICFVVNTFSQYLVEPRRVHLVATKHVMRYLKGTVDYGLNYTGDHDFRLFGYTDSDGAGSVSDGKSTAGGCLIWGQLLYRGLVESSPVLLSVLQRLNILQLVPPVVKPYGFESCCQVYLTLS